MEGRCCSLKSCETNETGQIIPINPEEKTNIDYKEELSVITTLWDELGITGDYRYQFNKILKHNIYSSKMLFFQEKESLQKFKTSLMKLKKEIYNR